MEHNFKIVALIPCYNVERYCFPVIEEALKWVSFLILVDDGSTDGTGKILEAAARAHGKQVHLIAFPENRGKGAALLSGMRYAWETQPLDVLVSLDADGQHLPSEIEKIAAPVQAGAALVIGSRIFSAMPLRSRIANTWISFFLRRIYPQAPRDNQSGFRAFSRGFLEKILREVSGARYEMEFRCILLALRDQDQIAERPIETIYLDQNRSSHFSKIRDSYRILCVLFRYWRSKSL